MRVDVAINYYGKPYQTLLTIETLLEHSGQHIDRIYLIREPKQPREEQDIVGLLARYGERIVVFQPEHYLAWSPSDLDRLLEDPSYRLSIRYQYAIEATDKRFLFVTHNDVVYTGDLVGELLLRMTEAPYAGAGLTGVCWSCPAYTVGICDHARREDLRLSYLQTIWLCLRVKSFRSRPRLIDRTYPLPLPECKLVDYACLLDVNAYLNEALPEGSSPLFGSFDGGIDTANGWFHSMVNKGYRFANVNIWSYCEHGHGSDGHGDLFDERRFETKERSVAAALHERGFDFASGSSAPPRVRTPADVVDGLGVRTRSHTNPSTPIVAGVDPSSYWRAQIARTRLENRLRRGEFAGARGLYWSARRAYGDPVKRLAGFVAVMLSPRLFAKATAVRPTLTADTPSAE